MRYSGGKNGSGTYQRIINQIPPHRMWIEPFAGSAAIARLKRPAENTLLIDRDPGAIDSLRGAADLPTNVRFLVGDGIAFLETACFQVGDFIYCDPPYLPETLTSRDRYPYTLENRDHRRLLRLLTALPVPAAVSGYWSPLYAGWLSAHGWRMVSFGAVTRGGWKAQECLWCNYPEPTALHDYRYLGSDYRQRENFKRQQKRWAAKLARMSRLQRQALLSVLRDPPGGTGTSADAASDTAASAGGGRHR
jgi:hypothetical protein